MAEFGKPSKISSIVAAICIFIYIAAIAFGAVRILLNIRERQNLAQKDFYDLADRATSSSVFLGFMSEAYQATIRDSLNASETLLGIVITGSSEKFAFEKVPGGGIAWTGESPRLKTGIWLNSEPLFMPVSIEGQRNATIQAVYSIVDFGLFQNVLRIILLLVLFALILSFLTLLAEIMFKKNKIVSVSAESAEKPAAPVLPPLSVYQSKRDDDPVGLYTPRGNISWESYIGDRLFSELHRCASFEQDLVLLVMELKCSRKVSDSIYNQFTDEAANSFAMRDLIFGKGDNGIAIIMPNTDLEHGMAKAEDFCNKTTAKLPGVFNQQAGKEAIELCIGLSSRSGRLIEADRLILEANTALEKAVSDPSSRIIAFRSDPEKYRDFVKGNH